MIVNGVTLPDLPAEVLETYPYLTCITLPWEVTMLVASTQKAAFYDTAEVTGTYGIAIFSYAGGTATVYGLESGATEWVVDEEPTTNGIAFWLHQVGLTDNSAFYPNHDICIATEYDNSAGKVTVGTEVWKAAVEYKFEEEAPTRVSIGRSLVDGFAKEVQRLTGTADQMNAIQIREKLSTVKAAIKIGDTVLPPIPEDALKNCPNAVIIRGDSVDGETVYMLLSSSDIWVYVPKNLIEQAESDGIITNTKVSLARMYALLGNEWMSMGETSNDINSIDIGSGSGATLLWSNSTIYSATAYDSSNKIPTIGTEVYFSERQNFNGVWLPKIPEDVLAEFPYAVVMRTTFSGTSMYEFWTANSPFFLAKGTAETEWIDMLVSKGSGRTGIVENDVMNGSDFGDVITKQEQPCGDIPAYGASFIPVWANHDIYEVASDNTSTDEYIAGGIYFPPLPAIDTDRVSIGYDLCDGIVEEVQRLSGESEKMDALHAYWKLTTVV